MLSKLTKILSKPTLFAGAFVANSVLISSIGHAEEHIHENCEPPPQRFEPAMVQCKTPGWVALTFDDGPHYNTPQILETLAAYDVKASFFIVGSRLSNPDYVQYLLDIVDQGHLLGNHSWSHWDMSNLRQVTAENELKKTNDLVWELAEYEMQFMRPPYGKLSLDSALAAWEFDQTIAMWNLDAFDYRTPAEWSAEQHLERIQQEFNNKSPEDSSHIILLHDFSPQTVQNLSAIIESAQAAGYRLGTMEDCLKL